jgi:hypothetical protein
MHPLIDKKIVDTIRSTGASNANLPDRVGVLEKHSLPYDRPAENVVISGCQVLPFLPQVLASLARLLDQGGVSYSFLSKEYCCGNFVYRPAIKAGDDEAVAECRELSREFVARNLEQAKELGAKRLVIFCSPCYPIYKHTFPDENIVFYPAAIAEAMEEIDFPERVDYYAGCYKLHRRLSPVPIDLASTEEVFAKMRGLELHRISAPKCCFDPKGLAHMIENVTSRFMVHVCTGCYGQARQHLGEDAGTQVLMLPEFVERAQS